MGESEKMEQRPMVEKESQFENSKQEIRPKWLLFLDNYPIYLLIPILIFISYIMRSVPYRSVFDVRAYYYGILEVWTLPAAAYADHWSSRGTMPFVYLPFFTVVFYPMTVWGFDVFVRLFLYTGIILQIFTFFLWDLIMREKKITALNRVLFLICLSVGEQFYFNLLMVQTKFYIIFTITLIIYADLKGWNKFFIHLCFQFLIALMMHLIFWYLFYILYNALGTDWHLNSSKPEKKLNPKTILPIESNLIIKNLLIECLIASLFFVVTNCQFLIHPELITGYFSQIFGNHLTDTFNYEAKLKFSILPYFIYLGTGWTGELMILTIIGFSVLLIVLVKKQSNLLDAIAWLSLYMILMDPLNEDHYYVFILPPIILSIAFNFTSIVGSNKKNARKFDTVELIFRIIGIFIIFLILLNVIKPEIGEPLRQGFLFIFISIASFFIIKNSNKNEKP
jgi:hypothetical protein